jgi:putative hydrolase of the HAD superfamily
MNLHKPQYKAISFDFGGTLAELSPKSLVIFQNLLRDIGYNVPLNELKNALKIANKIYKQEPPTLEQEKKHLIMFVKHFMKVLKIQYSTSDTQYIVKTFLNDHWYSASAYHIFDNAKKLLKKVKKIGLRTCIVANHLPSLKKVLKILELTCYFDTVVISSKVGFEKPNKRIFEIAMKRLHVKSHQLLHVGNELVDIDGAKNAGITPILIDRTGNKQSECIIIRNLNEILGIL